ncbi:MULTISPECIES: sensor histidine kinase [Flavobacterium]|uniref:Sensor histidine kinase n=1 Tax=Flavobacterium jumunjinense TaxID=998845 RepID=A0ABV5GMW6_9FLAO|nr:MULTISPECIES: sensor histidine kinase [Flavobacterium]
MNTINNRSFLKNSILVIVVIVLINTVQIFTLYQTKKFGDINFYNIEDHIFGIITCLFSFISTYLSWQFIAKKYTQKVIKIGLTFLVALLLFSCITSLYYTLLRHFVYHLSTSLDMLIGNIVFGLTTNHLYISGYTIAYLHFSNAKKLALDVERLEKEKILFQSKMLQKNLEPHFLFNNLSVLSNLAHKKPEQVEDFIDDFSDVYRYYLKHNQQEIVSLKEEIDFINSYMNLIQKRFNTAYLLSLSIEDKSGYIVPCTLQLCLENAIKHNFGSTEKPLHITIERIENQIVIKNEFRPVETLKSSKLGNQYLKNQYQIMFNQSITFETTSTHYIVKIPIIQ